ncbi:citrate lyase acyl carrier protein [Clostridium perfringens]|uniref:Citrate lyase acyl carrier protein n=2 Tax=Clostridium perfringens TaxID=1502 RepID=B1V5K1_CLOPF|nr:citrate lyase acyl carrier protein [Clostridium perfringens]EDT70913.1 citrate lyase acyl carrier protein [Clostridium perfringens D str. JGS1721]EGT5618418.1 citrate lyase acyl carrier protein [Clostridium perfringens]EHK2304868.1 citrate lyase acyl carrier protein [Clostridium perfringens]EIA17287.1 citrate lyase subunit gamma [Clostridium perfringens F262]ELC8366599.1 citrate lyase acyl carrier protein [Clostridium perfringens]
MEIKKPALAGTLESSDCIVSVEPSRDNTIEINLTSTVKKQFGNEIIRVAKETLKNLGVNSVVMEINDKGALNCVIEARIEAAVCRASEINEFDWGNYKCQD